MLIKSIEIIGKFYPFLRNIFLLYISYLYRDLESWLTGIKALVSSDELAKDVAGAEALLERHQVSVSKAGFPLGEWTIPAID